MRRLIRPFLAAALLLALATPLLRAAESPPPASATEAVPEPGLISGAAGRMVVSLLERFVPGLQIEGLRPIPGAITFIRLSMADAQGRWLEMDDVRLDFSLTALFRRDLRISELSVGELTVLRLPEAGPEQPPPDPQPTGSVLPSLPDLPVDIFVEKLNIARIEVPRELVGAAAAEAGQQQPPAPPFALALNGSASLVHAALQAKLAVQRLEAEGRLDLDLALNPQERLLVDLRAQEPPGGVLATALGIPSAPADLTIRLDGPASGADLRANAEFGGQAGLQATGRLALAPDGAAALTLQGHVDAPASLAPAPVRSLDIALDAGLLANGQPEVRRLHLTAPAGEVTAQGDLALLNLEARVAGSAALAPLVPDIIGWEGLGLTAQVRNGEQFEATLRPSGLRGPDPMAGMLGPDPVAEYRGTLSRIESLIVRGRGATLEASGTGWEQLDLTAKLTVPDLAAAQPELSGPVTVDARITGPAADPGISLKAQSPGLVAAGRRVESLDLAADVPAISGMAGTLRLTGRAEGQPISVALRAASEGDLVRLAEGEATFGPVRATASGAFNTTTTRFDGQAVVNADNLAPLAGLVGQPIGGALNIEARLNTDAEGRQAINAQARTRRLEYAGQAYAFDATVQGTDASADWRIDATLPQGKVDGRGRFSQGAQGMRLDIASLNAAQGEMGVRLAAPASILRAPSGAIEIPGMRLVARPAGSFTVSGRWGPQNADIRVALAALPASVVNMFVPEPRLRGTVVGEAVISGPTTAPEMRATLNGTGLRVEAPWSVTWPAATLRVEANRAGSGAVRANAALRMGNIMTFNAEANMPEGPGAEAPLSARVTGNADLQPLLPPSLGGGATSMVGRLVLDGGASGTLSAPLMNGTLALSGGEIRNPLYGLRLTNINGRLRAAGDQVSLENLTARAGNGRITLNGNAQPFAPGIPMEVSLTARNATPVQSELVTALLDADLRFTGPLQVSPALGGTVQLRRVAVNIPQSLPGGGVPTLGDVLVVGAAEPPAAPPGPAAPPIALNITVQAPQSILVRGRGLDAELGGTLNIGGTAAAPQPEGAFLVRRGTFQLLDRRLTFSQGSLTFDGDLTPSLDFTASTTAQGVTITVSIQGQPSNPQITFTSSPELPQDEILARLLFGRPLDRLSPFEIAQLAGGAASLAGIGPSGSRGFFGRIADLLGLDRLGVGGGGSGGNGNDGDNENSGPSLEAGGYIGQGVYVGVEQGAEGGPRVGVEVELTPRLKLESSTGGESGERIGLSYEVEY